VLHAELDDDQIGHRWRARTSASPTGSELSRLVGAAATTLAVSHADDDRTAAELGLVALLDRR